MLQTQFKITIHSRWEKSKIHDGQNIPILFRKKKGKRQCPDLMK